MIKINFNYEADSNNMQKQRYLQNELIKALFLVLILLKLIRFS